MSEIENAVIGCIAYNGASSISRCVARGVTHDWFTGKNAWIYVHALRLFSRNEHVDLVVLVNLGVDQRHLDNCVDAAHSPSEIDGYLDVLHRQYILRVSKRLADETTDITGNMTDLDVEDRLADIQRKWTSISATNSKSEPMHIVAANMVARWETPRHDEIRLGWPLEQLNRHMAPITDELIFLAAKESVGKTALALQHCLMLARKGIVASFLSLESSLERVAMRLIAQIGRVNTLPMVRRDPLADYQGAKDAAAKMADLPIRVTTGGMDITAIKAWAMNEKAAGSQLLVIDNMRHIRVKGCGSPVEQFRELSVQLKWMRDDVGLPVIVLHHLNDTGDVSWSKDIRRDADILIFLFHDDDASTPYDPITKTPGLDIMDIEISKNRDGQSNVRYKADFDHPTQTWYDYPRKKQHDITEDGL